MTAVAPRVGPGGEICLTSLLGFSPALCDLLPYEGQQKLISLSLSRLSAYFIMFIRRHSI